MISPRVFSPFAGACAFALMLLSPAAAAAPVSEKVVKAEFLPRFARYVTWPAARMPGRDQPFVLCVIGGDPLGAALDRAAAGQSVDGRRMVVRRMGRAEGVESCHVAFVQGSRSQPARQLLAALGRRPVLTVTDGSAEAVRGIIHFSIVGGRVRFFIDERQAAERGLAVNSRLLALAVGVKQK